MKEKGSSDRAASGRLRIFRIDLRGRSCFSYSVGVISQPNILAAIVCSAGHYRQRLLLASLPPR